MKVLITGGNGFIARNLSEQLGGEYDLVAPNSQVLNLLDADKVFDCLKSGKYDVVIHTATYDAAPKHSIKDPAKVLENNLRMFFNLARGKAYFGKMIYFGSGAEYSREHWVPKMKEEYFDQHVPTDQYGFSKYVMTKYAQLTDNIYNLRLFAVFGKYEDWRVRIISSICHAVAHDLPVRINQNKYYDFTHIDDLVKIVKWFIGNKPKKSVYNLCSGNAIDFKSIAEMVIKMSGKKLDIIIEAEGLGREYSGENALLMNELKGFKFSPMDGSIKDMYAWHNLNKFIVEGPRGKNV